MAKYEELYEDTIDLVSKMIEVIDEYNRMEVKMRADNKQKDLIKITKSNDLNKELGKYDIAITINQRIFEKLAEDVRLLSLNEKLSSLHYNVEKDKVELNPYDVQSFSGFLNKYGYEQKKRMDESIKLTYEQVAEEDKIAKDAAKMSRK